MDEAYAFVRVFTGDTLAPGRRRRGLAVEPMTCAPDASTRATAWSCWSRAAR
jgi:aldose 1-epimerase